MRIAVVDGQGGGIGKMIVERLRKALPEQVEILALGTNVLATSAMLKAGAGEGATGENAIVWNSTRVDVIAGAVGIIMPNALMGELTPRMAEAVADSRAVKLLLPLNRCNIEVVGMRADPLPMLIDDLAARALQLFLKSREGGTSSLCNDVSER